MDEILDHFIDDEVRELFHLHIADARRILGVASRTVRDARQRRAQGFSKTFPPVDDRWPRNTDRPYRPPRAPTDAARRFRGVAWRSFPNIAIAFAAGMPLTVPSRISSARRCNSASQSSSTLSQSCSASLDRSRL